MDEHFLDEDVSRRMERRKRDAEKRQQSHHDGGGDAPRPSGKDRQKARKEQAKQRYNNLKQIAKQLNIKDLLAELQQLHPEDWWGPDSAGDKVELTLGLFLNGVGADVSEVRHVGVWLVSSPTKVSQGEVKIICGHKQVAVDLPEAWSNPPEPAGRLLEMQYRGGDTRSVHQQLKSALEQGLTGSGV